MSFPNLQPLPDWAVVPPKQAGSGWTGGNSSPYGEAALDDECRKVATALPGSRNDQLNRSTFALAQLVAGGELDEAETRRRLEGAAIASGLDPAEIAATINSGFSGGAASPRAAPESKFYRPQANGAPGSPDAVQVAMPAFVATPYAWIDPASIPRRDWLYGRHLIRKFLSVTVAPGGVGKSSLLIAEALCLATGKPLLGQWTGSPLRVWLWNLEDPRDELQRRIQAACQYYGLTADDLGNRLFVDTGREQELCTAITTRSGAQIVRPAIENLIDQMRAHAIDVLIVDPFVSSHQVTENDNPAMDMVAKEWGRVADRTNSAIELVHHTRKLSGDVEVTAESSRGAKALTDAARDVRAINRMTKDEGDKAGVDNHRLYFRAYSDKANLSPPADKSDWFKLENVELANGDHVGVVIPWKWPDPFDGLTTAHLKAVQVAIDGKKLRQNSQAKDWAGYVIAEVLGMDADDKSDRHKIKSCINTWIDSGALRVGSLEDDKGKIRPILEVGEWAD